MTAEIAIMNKGGVALAADSAVTMDTRKGAKIYNSVNKLFMLSQYQPIGVMIWGSAEFLRVPWETIIKTYRKALGQTRLPKVKDYFEHFRKFIQSSDNLFPKPQRDRYITGAIHTKFYRIRADIDESVKAVISAKGRITTEQVARIANKTVKTCLDNLNQQKKLDCFKDYPETELRSLCKKVSLEATKKAFGNLPLAGISNRRLAQIAFSTLMKFGFGPQTSGLVIAGFGTDDVFPALISVIVDGIVGNELRYHQQFHQQISFANTASIIPFAQSEMVHTFMEGTDPDYKSVLYGYLDQMFKDYPKYVVGALLPTLKGTRRNGLMEKLRRSGKRILEDLRGHMDSYSKDNHVNPVIDAVAILPKDELAAMAESLVNLTSFKRRVSVQRETVGGPIDVAVISRGDGFIWIKRKHYFDPRLNPGFLANYYRENDNNP